VLRTGGPLHFELHVAEVIDPADRDFAYGSVPLVAQWYTARLEELIRRAPDQYWWLHHRWREPPPDGQRRRRKRKVAA
jgi:KDO2-lipid IV(A) lauroyltransferase